MLFHATITNFRKDARSSLFIFHRVFIRRTQLADVATQPTGFRSYSVKKHSSFPKSRATAWKGHTGERASTRISVDAGRRRCEEDPFASSPSQLERGSTLSNCPVSGSAVSGQGTLVPPALSTIPPTPSTKWELYEEILRLVSLTPPAPFSRLISLHQRYAMLQSIESYNILLHLSIRHSFSRHTQLLIKSMALNQIEPDFITEKLIIRHMVTIGRWEQAWQQVMTRYHSVDDIPMAVLLELLAPGTRNFLRPKRLPSVSTRSSSVESRPHPRSRMINQSLEKVEDGAPAFKIPLDSLILILRRFPQLSLDELARLPPRVVSYVVRGLIRNGHQEPALVLTENHLKSLPPIITPRRIDFARDLIHLHLSSGEIKLANYKKRRRLVERLLSLHPRLHPNATTVFLLMRFMERSKRCGIEAYLFFKDYRARWGTAVESLDVRRRIVAYAIKQRKFGIAKEISMEGPLNGPLPSLQPSVSGAPVIVPLRIRAWRTMYPRKGKGARLWKRLVFRLLGRRRGWKRKLLKVPLRTWPLARGQAIALPAGI